MVGKKGFTLIELLIVVTILSVLAGAAVPYVQDYLEDSRIARARTDLDEIKGALQRYELTRGVPYNASDVASLTGPFLSRALTDPWGAPYVVNSGSSTVYTKGADGRLGGGDDVQTEFRARMAVTQVFWIDTNQDGVVNNGDSLNLKCTRPLSGALSTVVGTDFAITGTSLPTVFTVATTNYNRIASYGLTIAANGFTPGSDTITIKAAGGLKDQGGTGGQVAMIDALTISAR